MSVEPAARFCSGSRRTTRTPLMLSDECFEEFTPCCFPPGSSASSAARNRRLKTPWDEMLGKTCSWAHRLQERHQLHPPADVTLWLSRRRTLFDLCIVRTRGGTSGSSEPIADGHLSVQIQHFVLTPNLLDGGFFLFRLLWFVQFNVTSFFFLLSPGYNRVPESLP